MWLRICGHDLEEERSGWCLMLYVDCAKSITTELGWYALP
jgi:hypothetical protein